MIEIKSAVPTFMVPDVARTAQWYAEHFGFRVAGRVPKEEPPVYASVQRNAVQGRTIQNQNSVAARVRNGWVDLQRRFAETSRRGHQVLVPNSGHGIPEEAPEL